MSCTYESRLGIRMYMPGAKSISQENGEVPTLYRYTNGAKGPQTLSCMVVPSFDERGRCAHREGWMCAAIRIWKAEPCSPLTSDDGPT